MAFISEYSLCKTCEGCDKLENDNFHGKSRCNDYVEDKSMVNLSIKEEHSPLQQYKHKVKHESKIIKVTLNDTEEGLHFIRQLFYSKGYFVSRPPEELENNENELVVLLSCIDNPDYEMRTNNPEIKNELWRKYLGD